MPSIFTVVSPFLNTFLTGSVGVYTLTGFDSTLYLLFIFFIKKSNAYPLPISSSLDLSNTIVPFFLAISAVESVQLSATINISISSLGYFCNLIESIKLPITFSSFLAAINKANL